MKIFDKFRKKKSDESLEEASPESSTARQGRPLPELWQWVGHKSPVPTGGVNQLSRGTLLEELGVHY